MQQITRFILLALLMAAIMTGGVWATENGSQTTEPIPTAPSAPEPTSAPAIKPTLAEYKRSDTNFYPKGDIVKSHPTAVILSAGG